MKEEWIGCPISYSPDVQTDKLDAFGGDNPQEFSGVNSHRRKQGNCFVCVGLDPDPVANTSSTEPLTSTLRAARTSAPGLCGPSDTVDV